MSDDGLVIDLHAEAWTEPLRGKVHPAVRRGTCCPYCTRLDRWVNSMGGYASARYIALCNEAREATSSPGEQWRYLEMAQAADEEHAASPGRWLADAIELANARGARAASRHADAEAAAVLQRVDEVKLAVDRLSEHPRLADDPYIGSGPEMSVPEIALRLRIAMGIDGRLPSRYEESLPPVADLARTIGVRS
jgi:hypothetical protein